MTFNSDQIFPKNIRTGISGITELRINATDGPNLPLDVTTNSQTIVDNFYSDKTLSKGDPDKGSKWVGQGIERMKFSCPSSEGTLDSNIYHACGNGNGLHWIHANGHEDIKWQSPSNDLRLWVRGVAVEPSSSGILMWILIILGLAIIGAGAFVFIKQKGK